MLRRRRLWVDSELHSHLTCGLLVPCVEQDRHVFEQDRHMFCLTGLRADPFAARTLRNMGATIDEATAATRVMPMPALSGSTPEAEPEQDARKGCQRRRRSTALAAAAGAERPAVTEAEPSAPECSVSLTARRNQLHRPALLTNVP